jgi:4-hydroxy-2-oxoheptanedioate aldolase
MIAEKAIKKGKIAGIHNGTTDYAKEMIELGYKFVTVSSDFRSMSTHAQNIVNEMKNNEKGKLSSSSY